MAEYDIETRKLRSGNIKTKYNVNGKPTKLETIDPRYVETCRQINNINQDILRQGDLEKITTIFKTN
jgi:capsid portal protein